MIEKLFQTILSIQIILVIYLFVDAFRAKKLDISKEKDLLRIPKLEEEISSLKTELDKAKASYTVATTALSELQKKKSDISEDLRKQKDSYETEKIELEQLRKESAQLKDALLIKEQALEKINSKTAALEKELNEKNNLLQTREQLNKEMTAGFSQLETNIEQLKAEIAEREKETQDRAQLQAQLDSLEKELNEKSNLLQTREQLNKEITARFGELETNIEQLKAEIAKREKETQARAQLQAQLDSLQADLEKVRSNYSEAQNALQELQKQKSDICEELRKQKDSYETEKIELEQLRKESAQLKDSLLIKEQELQKTISQTAALEKQLEEKNNLIGLLENQNKEMIHKVEALELRIKQLERDKTAQGTIIADHKTKGETKQFFDEEEVMRKGKIEAERMKKTQKIGEILLENNFITQDILNKALEGQDKSGGGITEFLIANGYIDESKIAQCLCTQFGIPYLPLDSYQISPQITKLVPVDIAEKYLILPVDKVGNILSVVMANPLNTKAIKEVEEITGLKVQVFLSLISEIIVALESYYSIVLKGDNTKNRRTAPFFINTKTYSGADRRNSIRYKTKLDINFANPDKLKEAQTIDVSRDGFLFEEVDNAIPVGTLLAFQINLPSEVSPLPIAALARVVRTTHLPNDKFQLGLKIIKISEQELNTIIGYAASHAET